jgi:heptosyltransferase-1
MDIVVRLSALGDIIHTAIILQFLPKKVDWLIEEQFAQILEHNLDINRVQKINLKSIKRRKLSIIREYKKLKSLPKYERAIDFQGLIKSAISSKIIANETIGSKIPREGIAKLLYSKELNANLHTIDRYRVMINELYGLNISQDEFRDHKPFLFFQDSDFRTKSYFKKDNRNIIFIIGANSTNRIYPKEKWVELADSLKENILIPYGSKSEKEFAQYIEKNSKYAKTLPKTDLNGLKATISNADLLIGNDTGPSYIAWANNIKNILLYGATPKSRILENSYTKVIKSKTSKCSEKFNRDDFSIKDIEVGEILRAIEKF